MESIVEIEKRKKLYDDLLTNGGIAKLATVEEVILKQAFPWVNQWLVGEREGRIKKERIKEERPRACDFKYNK